MSAGEGITTLGHIIPISTALALDYGLLTPGSPAHTEAVQRQQDARYVYLAWRRSWPGRRARAHQLARRVLHAAQHRLAHAIDPGCVDLEED